MLYVHASSRTTATRRGRKVEPGAESLEGRLLLTAGALDVLFGTGGYVLASTPATKTSTPSDLANAVAIQSDGKILAAGDGVFNGVNSFEVTRITAAGALDTSFGSGGRAFPLSGGSAKDMVVQSDGRIVVAGYVTVTSGSGKTSVTQYDVALVRLLENGTLDPSFGQGGKVVTGISTSGTKYDSAYAVALQPDGKIVVGGDTYGSSAAGMDSLLLRYNANGSLDTSFGQGGKVVTAWSSGDDNVADVVIQGDGKILVAGKGYLNENGSYPCYVARYNANGSLDDGSSNDLSPADRFGSAGIVTTPFAAKGPGELSAGDSLALQSDGSIIFARSGANGTDYDLAVARFTAAGMLDVANFGSGDGFVTLGLVGEQVGRSVAIQADDKIVLAGDFSGSGQIVARFDRNGSLDRAFGSGGYALNAFGSSSVTEDIALQADGKIVAVGAARVPSGKLTTNALLVARYLGDSGPVSNPFGPRANVQITPSTAGYASVPVTGVAGSDLDLTTLATELIRGRKQRTRTPAVN